MTVWKRYEEFYWKYPIYLALVAVLLFYVQEFYYILNHFHNNLLVRLFYFRYFMISIIFILCFIIFYYKFFRRVNSRNYLFVLLGAIILYSMTLFIKGRELSLPLYTLDYLFYMGNLCLVLVLLSMLIKIKK